MAFDVVAEGTARQLFGKPLPVGPQKRQTPEPPVGETDVIPASIVRISRRRTWWEEAFASMLECRMPYSPGISEGYPRNNAILQAQELAGENRSQGLVLCQSTI